MLVLKIIAPGFTNTVMIPQEAQETREMTLEPCAHCGRVLITTQIGEKHFRDQYHSDSCRVLASRRRAFKREFHIFVNADRKSY